MGDEEETAEMNEEEAEETAENTETTEKTEAEEPKKEKKKKKLVRRRKTKKEKENPLTLAVRLAVESGKVEFGGRAGSKAGLSGSAKMFILAANAPSDIRMKIETYAKASNIPIVEFEGNTMELGSVCGKPFPVSVLSIFEEGSSNLLSLAKKK